MGGDEFCVLLSGAPVDRDERLAAALAALHETGDGFEVSAACGIVAIPAEAQTASDALRLADQRMYREKRERRVPAEEQTMQALLHVLRERQPDLEVHCTDVAELAVAVGGRLGLDRHACLLVRRAAELHDIGKAAIPDAVLNKPGPLDETEWAFMRRHTLIGERIVARAEALAPVGPLIRSSHERWDGGGYPDGLRGEQIPLGARIVAVCDAYAAITTDRVYRAGRPAHEALVELRRCAGTQFDPAVVETFAAVLAERDAPPAELRLAG
jgi:HD-GYP domain-containing protein (c-di-GMP phosphodiesterase class II)